MEKCHKQAKKIHSQPHSGTEQWFIGVFGEHSDYQVILIESW